MESGKQLSALFLVILLLGLAGGQSRAADDSLFEVTGAHTAIVYEVYVVDANIRMRLTKHAREALQNGVPLEILVEVEVLRERPWLWDETIEHIRKTYRLSYHALSDRYIVKHLDAGTSASYTSLEEALFELGTIREMPVLPQQRVLPDQKYMIRIRAALLTEALPVPVRLWAYVSSRWRSASDWYAWPLQP
jgi:hypothetical protein